MAASEPALNRRGRPPRFSREQIVEAVAEMLLADPSAPLTIARAAEAVGAKPMSLYRHFTDRDDLVAAVTAHVFAGTRPDQVPDQADEPWQEQLRYWMTSVYRRAQEVPQLVQLAATGESAEWLMDSSWLAKVFEASGAADDATIAEAVYWVATTTMGHVLIAAAGHDRAPVGRVRTTLDRLDGADADRMRRLLPHFDVMRHDGFDRVVEWTIAGVEELLRSSRRGC